MLTAPTLKETSMDFNAHLLRGRQEENFINEIETALQHLPTLSWYQGLLSDDHRQAIKSVVARAQNITPEANNTLTVEEETLLHLATIATTYERAINKANTTMSRLHNN